MEDLNKAERIQRAVMLLRQPEWPELPIRHLLPFAELFIEELLDHQREAGYFVCFLDLLVVGLHVDEVFKMAVELQLWETLLEHADVAAEAKADADCFLACENRG